MDGEFVPNIEEWEIWYYEVPRITIKDLLPCHAPGMPHAESRAHLARPLRISHPFPEGETTVIDPHRKIPRLLLSLGALTADIILSRMAMEITSATSALAERTQVAVYAVAKSPHSRARTKNVTGINKSTLRHC
jgi:hypothetical protein